MDLPVIEDNITKEYKERYNIQNFPRSVGDPQDPHFALDQFIETSITVLDLADYEILYNDNYIYRQEEKYIRGRRTHSLKELTIEYRGEESYWGVDLYLGLLNARLNDPFELLNLEITAYDEHAIRWRERFLSKLQFTDVAERKNKIIRYPAIFPLQRNVNLELRNEGQNGRYGRGQIKWRISVPNHLLSCVMDNILETSGIRDFAVTDYGFVIRQINPKGYTYYVEAFGV